MKSQATSQATPESGDESGDSSPTTSAAVDDDIKLVDLTSMRDQDAADDVRVMREAYDDDNISEDDDALSYAESELSDESCHTPPAAEIPSVHKEAKYIVFISSLLNLISMCCWSVCGSRALQTRHEEVADRVAEMLRFCQNWLKNS